MPRNDVPGKLEGMYCGEIYCVIRAASCRKKNERKDICRISLESY